MSARRLFFRASQLTLDISVLAGALVVAFMLRFDWEVPGDMLRRLAFVAPYVIALQYAVLLSLGVPSFSWRYFGLREASRIAAALVGSSSVLLAARLISAAVKDEYRPLRYALIPIGVIAIDWLLAFVGLVGVRALRRVLGERRDARRHVLREEPATTLVVGAGSAGLLVAKEVQGRPSLGLKIIGFVDDDADKLAMRIHGLPVMGTTEDLPRLCLKHGAKQVLIAIARASGAEIRRINRICEETGVTVKIVPGISEIVGGHIGISRIRDLAIEDLLRRAPVDLDTAAISGAIAGRVVMVTGAGGSIGAELCRQVQRFSPRALLLVERSENSLFESDRQLRERVPEVPVVPLLADICDEGRMSWIFSEQRPEFVLHAAALKHVPMVERNVSAAIANNILGTRTLAQLAVRHGVESFVMISTDKAVRPTSVMGASKRVAELYVQSLAARGKTRFTTVRFGNVLGSAGSVVPIFREQIAGGGPVKVTHPEMKRYFMTIPEACQLVLQAGTMGQGGEIFILDMGEPVKIVDLACDVIRLSGLRPYDDVAIEFTGVRPGEKLFEELSAEEELDHTTHPHVLIERGAGSDPGAMEAAIDGLADAAARQHEDAIRALLREVVPSYAGSGASPAGAEAPARAEPPAPGAAPPVKQRVS